MFGGIFKMNVIQKDFYDFDGPNFFLFFNRIFLNHHKIIFLIDRKKRIFWIMEEFNWKSKKVEILFFKIWVIWKRHFLIGKMLRNIVFFQRGWNFGIEKKLIYYEFLSFFFDFVFLNFFSNFGRFWWNLVVWIQKNFEIVMRNSIFDSFERKKNFGQFFWRFRSERFSKHCFRITSH